MKEFVGKIKNSNRIKQFVQISQLVLSSLYIFSLPSFSGRARFNLISYFLMGLLLVNVIFDVFIYKKNKIRAHYLLLPAFVSFALLSTALFSHHFREWLTLFLLSLTYFVFLFVFLNNNKFVLARIVTCSLFCFSLYFLIIYRNQVFNLSSFTDEHSRLGWYFDNVNQIGSYFSVAYIFSLFIVLFSNKKIDLLFVLPALLFVYEGITTGSKAFMFSFVVSTLTLIIIRFRHHKIRLLILVVSLVATFIVLINLPFLSLLKDRILSMFSTLFGVGGSNIDGSTLQRFLWQEYSLYLASKNLFLGLGESGFAVFSGVGTYSHANYSEMLCNFGLLGFVLFYVPIVLPLFFINKNKQNVRFLSVALSAFLIVSSFMEVFYYDKIIYVCLGFMLSINDDILNIRRSVIVQNIYQEITI